MHDDGAALIAATAAKVGRLQQRINDERTGWVERAERESVALAVVLQGVGNHD